MFTVETLLICNLDDVDRYEIRAIELYDSIANGYNVTKGGKDPPLSTELERRDKVSKTKSTTELGRGISRSTRNRAGYERGYEANISLNYRMYNKCFASTDFLLEENYDMAVKWFDQQQLILLKVPIPTRIPAGIKKCSDGYVMTITHLGNTLTSKVQPTIDACLKWRDEARGPLIAKGLGELKTLYQEKQQEKRANEDPDTKKIRLEKLAEKVLQTHKSQLEKRAKTVQETAKAKNAATREKRTAASKVDDRKPPVAKAKVASREACTKAKKAPAKRVKKAAKKDPKRKTD